jgi:hypothetical protein
VVVAVVVVLTLLMPVLAAPVVEHPLNTCWMFQAFLPQLLLLVPVVVLVVRPGKGVMPEHLVGLVEEIPTQEMVERAATLLTVGHTGGMVEPHLAAH